MAPVNLPLTALAQAVDAAKNQAALDGLQAIDEQNAIQVIHFVLQRPRQQPVCLDGALLAVAVESANHGMQRSPPSRESPAR
jgi:hypothetical protein